MVALLTHCRGARCNQRDSCACVCGTCSATLQKHRGHCGEAGLCFAQALCDCPCSTCVKARKCVCGCPERAHAPGKGPCMRCDTCVGFNRLRDPSPAQRMALRERNRNRTSAEEERGGKSS